MTKNQAERNMSGNILADRVMQGVALFVILGLAYKEILDHVPTENTNMRYGLAAMPLVIALYLLITPIFRSSK